MVVGTGDVRREWRASRPGDADPLEVLDLAGLQDLAPEWNALALAAGTPFLTVEWLAAVWRGAGGTDAVALVHRGPDGALRAGACFRRDGGRGRLAGLATAHSGDWDAVAVDEPARHRFWTAVAAAAGHRLVLPAVPADPDPADVAHTALTAAGRLVVAQPGPASPWLALPGSFDDLLAARSRNLRSQVGRKRRALEREGTLEFRATTGGPRLEADLKAFLAVEASGWKGRAGTAILADAATATMYREFAQAAAGAGWLRLYTLELDGRVIAADFGIAFAGTGFLLKTGFDEELDRFAPGLVLRAEVLRASIEEGLHRYDFLGGPDAYKLRWTDTVRERSTLRAFRGARGLPGFVWWAQARPALKRARDAVHGWRAGPADS